MAFKRPESALVVIYDEDNRVLVLQREDDNEFWQSVTGTLEEDEKPVDTAYREVFEETGIDIAAGHFSLVDHQVTNQYAIRQIWRHRYPANCRYNTEYLFSVKVKSNMPISLTEHLSYEWLDKAAAVKRVWSETNKQGILDCVPCDKQPLHE